jgi:hypothetical protein
LEPDLPPRHLELTIHRGDDPLQDIPLIETREDVSEGQDPSPSIAAFNKSFVRHTVVNY